MSSVQKAVTTLDFSSEGAMWFTEVTLYICFILIWWLLCKILWYFCISPLSPKFKQYDARMLKPIKKRAEDSRIRRNTEMSSVQTDTNTVNTAHTNTNTLDISDNGVARGGIGSMSADTTRSRLESTTLRTNTITASTQQNQTRHRSQSKSITSFKDETPEEFQLQICKIHRNLRICFVTSLCCTAINVTSVMLNHTLIISGAVGRNCTISRLPVTANLGQRIALYLFFIFRLHYSFGKTQFGLKPIWIYLLIAGIVLFGGGALFYFFFRIITASDPCNSDLAGSAAIPAVGQDFFFNLLLSVLFLTRLTNVIKSQSKFKQKSTRDLSEKKLKAARANYKYYYTMYKLTVLFIVAALITIMGFVILFIFSLAAATAAMDSVASNYLLFLSFQFNDHWFRMIFCGCLKLQALCLGKEYAKDMEIHFFNAKGKKAAHKMSSRTWQDGDVETMNETTKTNKEKDISTIHEEGEHDAIDNNSRNGSDPTPTNPDDNDNEMKIIITPNVDDVSKEDDDGAINRINTMESSLDADASGTNNDNDQSEVILPHMTPVDTNVAVLNVYKKQNYDSMDMEIDPDRDPKEDTPDEDEDEMDVIDEDYVRSSEEEP